MYDKAEDCYKKALEIDPKDVDHLGNYAGFLLARGNEYGFSILEKAIKDGHTHPDFLIKFMKPPYRLYVIFNQENEAFYIVRWEHKEKQQKVINQLMGKLEYALCECHYLFCGNYVYHPVSSFFNKFY